MIKIVLYNLILNLVLKKRFVLILLFGGTHTLLNPQIAVHYKIPTSRIMNVISFGWRLFYSRSSIRSFSAIYASSP